MTVQPLQPSTFHSVASFPSEPENHFRAVVGSVVTDTDTDWHEVDARFQIGFGGTITSLQFGAGVDLDEDGSVFLAHDRAEIAKARADLDFFNQQWSEFYAAAISALGEIPFRGTAAA